ncbi:MAG: hypothetical protein ABI333_19325 [bacterium]
MRTLQLGFPFVIVCAVALGCGGDKAANGSDGGVDGDGGGGAGTMMIRRIKSPSTAPPATRFNPAKCLI